MAKAIRDTALGGIEGEPVERPRSIVRFERFYLGAVALKIVGAILNWDSVNAGGVQIGIIVALLLWFGVMYRHSVASKWIVVVIFLASALWALFQIMAGAYGATSTLFVMGGTMLNAVAVWYLIADNAQGWFEEAAVPPAG